MPGKENCAGGQGVPGRGDDVRREKRAPGTQRRERREAPGSRDTGR